MMNVHTFTVNELIRNKKLYDEIVNRFGKVARQLQFLENQIKLTLRIHYTVYLYL